MQKSLFSSDEALKLECSGPNALAPRVRNSKRYLNLRHGGDRKDKGVYRYENGDHHPGIHAKVLRPPVNHPFLWRFLDP